MPSRDAAAIASLRFSHIGVAVPSISQALATYQAIFGYVVLSGPFDDPVQHVSVCFLGTGEPGDLTIELVAPLGDNSPVSQVLAKGIGAYHICYEVDEIEAALEYVRSQGCLVVSKPVPATAFAGKRIAWFYTPTRQLVELVER
jgi:methylmalonyl-CoA/ethylmalonyl-CoA epimerase